MNVDNGAPRSELTGKPDATLGDRIQKLQGDFLQSQEQVETALSYEYTTVRRIIALLDELDPEGNAPSTPEVSKLCDLLYKIDRRPNQSDGVRELITQATARHDHRLN